MNRGYSSKITDYANEALMGGPSKIDSVQNLITLRCDLHSAWNNYEFGVDPNVSSTPWNSLYIITLIYPEQLLHHLLYKWECRF